MFVQFHILYLFNMIYYRYTVQVHPWADSQDRTWWGECPMWSACNHKDDFYKISVTSTFLINVLMSLTC